MAVAAGSVESAQLFRESGADVHASTSDVKNCLHLAVDSEHLEMLQLLLEDKKTSENLYKSDARERVPLHNAATCPNIKVPITNFIFSSYSRSFIASPSASRRAAIQIRRLAFELSRSRLIVCLGNTLYSHSVCLYSRPSPVWLLIGTGKFNTGGTLRSTNISYGLEGS